MKFLLIAYYFPPLNSGGTKRPFQIANYLKKNGHQVTVLTGTYAGKDHFINGEEIRIHDPSHNCNRKGIRKIQFFILRLYSELLNISGFYSSIYSWWKRRVKNRAAQIIKLVQPDYILTTYPPVEDLELGIFMSVKFKIPLISDFRDGLLFEPIEERRILRYLKIKRTYQEIEQKTLELSKTIITASEPISEYFRERYQRREVITIINGYIEPFFSPLFPKREEGMKGHFKIIHTGQLKLSDSKINSRAFFSSIRQILEEFPDLKDKIKLFLAGRLSKRELKNIKDLIKSGIVVYKGLVDPHTAIKIQESADLLLTITSTNRKSVISTKFIEYLRTGRPILALTKDTQQEKILRETSAGWACHPKDTEKITQLLKRILFDIDFYNSITPNLSKIKEYAFINQLKELEKIFNNASI